MDEQLKKLVEQIQAQNLGKIVAPEKKELSIQDYAQMEPPRPDYSDQAKPSNFNKTKEYIKTMNNSLVVDPNFISKPSIREVYPTPEQELNAQQQAFKSIREAFNGDPDYKTLDEIERLKKLSGSK